MKIIDLSHLIYSDMPVYPGTESPILQQVSTLDKDHYRETKITLYSHTGTHIDAPGHMVTHGPNLDNMNINHFFGKATILDLCNHQKLSISHHDLISYQQKIGKVDFVVLKTGWSQYWGKSRYYENYPFLSHKAAEWLSEFHLKGIGIDSISIDASDSIDFSVHTTFLANDMIIIENLTNLDAVQEEFFLLSVLPLKIKNADGSPVRAIAVEISS